MTGVCFLVAGAAAGYLATAEFTLAWRHSVEHTRWEERYRIEGARLRLVEASVEGTGAGMEPPPGARLADGRWRWRPPASVHDELRLTTSGYTADYDVCVAQRCTPLASLVAPAHADVVVVRACDGKASPRGR